MLREIYGRIAVLEERNTAALAISKHLSKRVQALEEQYQQMKSEYAFTIKTMNGIS